MLDMIYLYNESSTPQKPSYISTPYADEKMWQNIIWNSCPIVIFKDTIITQERKKGTGIKDIMILVKTLTVTLWTWLQTIFVTRGASQSPKFRSEVIGHTVFTATTLKTRYELISTTIITFLSRISFLK